MAGTPELVDFKEHLFETLMQHIENATVDLK